MVLDWYFDIPAQKLSVKIADNLEYIALEGGYAGFEKIFNGETTHLTYEEWEHEKVWISERFADVVGTFQPDYSRTVTLPSGIVDECPMGVGPDGRYLDHMQRRQAVLDGEDQAIIGYGLSGSVYSTIDNGKTIFRRTAHRNVRYLEMDEEEFKDFKWIDNTQPCMQQPWAEGVKVSSYIDMQLDGIPEEDIEKCKQGLWDDAPNTELQKLYKYPEA